MQEGVFYLNTIDVNGCKGADTVTVSGYVNVFVPTLDTAVCENNAVQLNTVEGNYIYKWEPSSSLSNPTIFNPISTPGSTTIYTVSITNGPCVTSNTISVQVYPIPTIEASPSVVTVLPGESIDIVAFADNIIYWSPPRSVTCVNCNSNSVSPDVNTVFYATTYNSFGCKSIDSVQILVSPVIYLPNAFTPNGDYINGIFKPEHIGIISIEVIIFNRWGELIYKFDTLDGGWDGTYNGKPAQQDVYIYKLVATDFNHDLIEKSGTVTLVR